MSFSFAVAPSRQRVQYFLQVWRQADRKFDAPAVARMLERDPFRMKKRALQAGHRANVARHAPVNATVHRIANDRMADGAEMNANLVRSSRVNGHLAKRQARHLERPGDSGNGFPRASRPRGHLLPMDRIA